MIDEDLLDAIVNAILQATPEENYEKVSREISNIYKIFNELKTDDC